MTTKTKCKVEPLGDKVLLRRDEAEERSPGGIVMPDSAKEKPKRGVILAVGKGRRLQDGGRSELDVEIGDTVIFGSYAGSDVKVDGEDMLLISENEILAIVRD